MCNFILGIDMHGFSKTHNIVGRIDFTYKSKSQFICFLHFFSNPFFLFFFCAGGFFLVSVADNLSNYFFHTSKFGYRTYDTKDNSRNVPLISYIALGAGWHNNHHNSPANYRFGELPNEIDISGLMRPWTEL